MLIALQDMGTFTHLLSASLYLCHFLLKYDKQSNLENKMSNTKLKHIFVLVI